MSRDRLHAQNLRPYQASLEETVDEFWTRTWHEPQATRYYLESFVEGRYPEPPRPAWLERYLLDLMEARDYTVIEGSLEREWPAPKMIRYPEGFVLVRVSVLVREWDVEV